MLVMSQTRILNINIDLNREEWDQILSYRAKQIKHFCTECKCLPDSLKRAAIKGLSWIHLTGSKPPKLINCSSKSGFSEIPLNIRIRDSVAFIVNGLLATR
jgi:hypothetical protein